MAKRKSKQTEPEVQVAAEIQAVQTHSTIVEPVTPKAPKVPKKRIRIRKKATKKLSAAIICKDPTIQRFI